MPNTLTSPCCRSFSVWLVMMLWVHEQNSKSHSRQNWRLRWHFSPVNQLHWNWKVTMEEQLYEQFNAETAAMALPEELEYHLVLRRRRTSGKTAACSLAHVGSRVSMMPSTIAATVSWLSRRGASACRQHRHATTNSPGWRHRCRTACCDGTGYENWRRVTEILTCDCCLRDHHLAKWQTTDVQTPK